MPAAPPMGSRSVLRTTVVVKAVMALSGALLLGFVVAHMTGNLKAFQGAEKFNEYAEFIRTFGAPALPRSAFLWIQRVGLLGIFLAHVGAAWTLARRSRAARGSGYRGPERSLGFSYASRTMRWGGVILLLFVIYHLLHFTTGHAHPDFVHGNAYHNLVVGFTNPLVVAVYVLAVSALAFHLWHGVWSAFQTLGLDNPRYVGIRRPLAMSIAVLLWIGFLIVPAAVLAGWIR